MSGDFTRAILTSDSDDLKSRLSWALMIAFEREHRLILGRHALPANSLLGREVAYKIKKGEKI